MCPYIPAMISSDLISDVTRNSVACIRKTGQMPKLDMTIVRRADGIVSVVSGRAIRFVRRKYLGNVPK